MPPPEVAGIAPTRARVPSIDVVRGAAVVLMALDHVRDYTSSLRFAPENLARSTLPLFLTRWVTHFCAPTFALLAGVGIGLAARTMPVPALRRFLLTRGLWLLVLELVVTPLGWQLGVEPWPAFALVLWMLGWSMVLMAAIVGRPRPAIGWAALVVIAGHNLFDGVRPEPGTWAAAAWAVLHVPGFLWPGGLFIGYPLVPWVAVVALGYAVAPLFTWEARRRRQALLVAGASAWLLFVLLRASNGYGNPAPWRVQNTPGLTVASFLNVLKYPPSLQFLLMTLGGTALSLAWAERAGGRAARVLATYGRVPLFFYTAHIFVAHGVAVLLAFAQSGAWQRIPIVTHPERVPAWFGVSLPGVYVAWALVVGLLYVPCRWMDRAKSTRSEWWWRYL